MDVELFMRTYIGLVVRGVLVDRHKRFTNCPFLRTRKPSRGWQAMSSLLGVSRPSSASRKVPWWIAMLVLTARISWALTASAGDMCTLAMNQRGSYAPIGNNAACGDPNFSRI